MKNFTRSLCFLLILTFTSCEKEQLKPKGVEGEWVWTSSVGGFAGLVLTPESTMNIVRLEIDETTFKEYVNNSLKFSSAYTIVKDNKPVFGSEDSTYIKFVSGVSKSFMVDDTSLMLVDNLFDGFAHRYRRK